MVTQVLIITAHEVAPLSHGLSSEAERVDFQSTRATLPTRAPRIEMHQDAVEPTGLSR